MDYWISGHDPFGRWCGSNVHDHIEEKWGIYWFPLWEPFGILLGHANVLDLCPRKHVSPPVNYDCNSDALRNDDYAVQECSPDLQSIDRWDWLGVFVEYNFIKTNLFSVQYYCISLGFSVLATICYIFTERLEKSPPKSAPPTWILAFSNNRTLNYLFCFLPETMVK